VITFIISFSALFGTIHGHGPFHFSTPYINTLLAHLFLIVTSLSGLIIVSYLAEKALIQNKINIEKEHYRLSQSFANVGTWVWKIETGERFWSERITSLLGYQKSTPEATYPNFIKAVHPEDRSLVESAIQNCIEKNLDYDIKHRVIWDDNSVHWLHEKGSVTRDLNGQALDMIGTISDITINKSFEEKIQSQLNEKNILLREVHHRVKNNLQTIISLIAMQTNNSQSQEVQDIFKGLQSRLLTIAMVHKQLYDKENTSSVNLYQFINELMEHASSLFDFDQNNINLTQLNKNLLLDLDRVIACGLIINELITNSLKHIFPLNNGLQIQLTIDNKDKEILVSYTDNGPGSQDHATSDNPSHLGLKLISLLSQQLQAKHTLNLKHSCDFQMRFKA